MSLSCLGHGWARVARQALATLLGIGKLELVSGPAEEVRCCCKYKAWRAWCLHQECHRKQTSGAGSGRGGRKGVQKESESTVGTEHGTCHIHVSTTRVSWSLGPGWGCTFAQGLPRGHNWDRAPPEIPAYWKPCLRVAGAGETSTAPRTMESPFPTRWPSSSLHWQHFASHPWDTAMLEKSSLLSHRDPTPNQGKIFGPKW